MDNNFDVERELDELYQEVTLGQVITGTGIAAISIPVAIAIKKQIDKSRELDKTIEKEFEEVKKGKNHKKLIITMLTSVSIILAAYGLLKANLKKKYVDIANGIEIKLNDAKTQEKFIDDQIKELKEHKNELRKYLSKDRLTAEECNDAIWELNYLTGTRENIAKCIEKNVKRTSARNSKEHERVLNMIVNKMSI